MIKYEYGELAIRKRQIFDGFIINCAAKNFVDASIVENNMFFLAFMDFYVRDLHGR